MEGVAQIALGCTVAAGCHPITLAKTLMQLGYEPVPPTETRTLWNRRVFMYPNVFTYIGYIKRRDGYRGLFRGLGTRIVSNVVGNISSSTVHQSLTQNREKSKAENMTLVMEIQLLCADTLIETVSRGVGVVVSQPFQVIFVRMVAQYVGEETVYKNVFGSMSEIWNNEGIQGFFSGLAPRLLGEMLTIWMANFLTYGVTRALQSVLSQDKSEMRGIFGAMCQLIVTQVTYPFTLISTLMAVRGSGLKAAKPVDQLNFSHWIQYWHHLSEQHQLKRGSTLFRRFYTGPMTVNVMGESVPSID